MEVATTAASYKNWTISIATLEESSVINLIQSGVVVANSDSAYSLLSNCPVDVADNLRTQLVQREITLVGGVDKFRSQAYSNQLKYGTSCYDYLDTDTLQAFAKLGIYLSHKV
jgi:hypothetical protein